MAMKAGWDAALSVGIIKVDIQHKTLIRMISELHDSVTGEAKPVSLDRLFLELKAYASVHFDEEERMFESCNHPLLEQHQKMHRSFVERIDQFLAEKNGRKSSTELQVQVLDYLMDWLVKHIREVDQNHLTTVKKWREEKLMTPGVSG